MVFSPISKQGCLNNTVLLKAASLKWLLVWEQWAEHSKDRGGDEELLTAWVQLLGQMTVTSSR